MIRKALITVTNQMQIIRNPVKENILSDIRLARAADSRQFILDKKKMVLKKKRTYTTFPVVDLKDNLVQALFAPPD